MPRLTQRRAQWLAAFLAVLVYLLALRNGWAGDDLVAVRDNPATHSVGAALRAWFEPYWPGDWRWAGLYRPFTILTYGIDWTISGGQVWWLHLSNVLLHGAATGLAVAVIGAWLPPLGALAAGALFAVHPVHVEAVANVVGRAELLAALGLLGAVLAARRRRRAGTWGARLGWLMVTALAVALAMFSKEHGVIAIAVLALDHAVGPRQAGGSRATPYLAVATVTITWLFLWRGIAGPFVAAGAHAAFFGLSAGERAATMFPVYLEVLRLLAWPLQLSSDYAPQFVPVRHGWSWIATLGAGTVLAALALAVLLVRRAPGIAFAGLLAALSYAPTSNIILVSGVMLAERNLYLAVLAPAVVLGWGVSRLWNGRHGRSAAALALTLLAVCTIRTIDRIPFWHDLVTPVLEEQTAHPENFHIRILLADLAVRRGDSAWALAEVLVAGDLFPSDPGAALLAARHARAQGRGILALREARRAAMLNPGDPRILEVLVAAEEEAGTADSAVAAASRAIESAPGQVGLLVPYQRALEAANAPEVRIRLARVRYAWLSGNLVAASRDVDSLVAAFPAALSDSGTCVEARRTLGVLRALRPELAGALEQSSSGQKTACDITVPQ